MYVCVFFIILFFFFLQDLRRELDSVLERKVANPRMKLYDPAQNSHSPISQLIQAIMDLITTEDYSLQVRLLVDVD